MIVTVSEIHYIGKNKKAIEVKNLVVDGHAFGNRILDIESNLFAKLVIDYARKNNIEITESKEYPSDTVFAVSAFSNQREMELEKFSDIMESKIRITPQERGYDSPETLVSYMFSNNEQYKKEAKNFIEWRDQAYAKIFAIIDKFKTDDTYNLPDIGEVFEDIGPIDWDK